MRVRDYRSIDTNRANGLPTETKPVLSQKAIYRDEIYVEVEEDDGSDAASFFEEDEGDACSTSQVLPAAPHTPLSTCSSHSSYTMDTTSSGSTGMESILDGFATAAAACPGAPTLHIPSSNSNSGHPTPDESDYEEMELVDYLDEDLSESDKPISHVRIKISNNSRGPKKARKKTNSTIPSNQSKKRSKDKLSATVHISSRRRSKDNEADDTLRHSSHEPRSPSKSEMASKSLLSQPYLTSPLHMSPRRKSRPIPLDQPESAEEEILVDMHKMVEDLQRRVGSRLRRAERKALEAWQWGLERFIGGSRASVTLVPLRKWDHYRRRALHLTQLCTHLDEIELMIRTEMLRARHDSRMGVVFYVDPAVAAKFSQEFKNLYAMVEKEATKDNTNKDESKNQDNDEDEENNKDNLGSHTKRKSDLDLIQEMHAFAKMRQEHEAPLSPRKSRHNPREPGATLSPSKTRRGGRRSDHVRKDLGCETPPCLESL